MVEVINTKIGDRLVTLGLERPDTPALSYNHVVVRYGELLQRVDCLALELKSLVVNREPIAAIHSGRCPGLVVAVLACVRAGIPFAVLDSAYPGPRLSGMASVLKPSIFVGVGQDCLGWGNLYDSFDQAAYCELDRDGMEFTLVKGEQASTAFIPSTLAYYLFTSGTTGTPKCIQTSHAPLVHFVDWYLRRFNPGPGDRFSMLSGLGHDPILRDIFVPLSAGACLTIPSQAILTQPSQLYRWLKEEEITFVHTTPPMLKVIVAGVPPSETLDDLKWIFSGGDALRLHHVQLIRQLAPQVQLINFYGATETPQAMGWHPVDLSSTDDPVPAGKGIDDVELLVLDGENRCVGQGVVGQVGVRTRYLSEGYKDDPGQTAARFVICGEGSLPIYLTGDRGELRVDGTLVLRGRSDDQVKIRGYRIELAEIALVLGRLPCVRDVVVLALPGDDGENRLEAFLVARVPVSAPESLTLEVRNDLRKILTPAQVPSVYHWLTQLPLQPNGKYDRSALKAVAQEARSSQPDTDADSDSSPQNPFAEGMRRILGVAVLEPELSFADHGGDSLSFIRASALIEKHLGSLPPQWERLPLSSLFSTPGTQRSWLGTVATPVLMRAVGILLVLFGHIMFSGWPGATTALFVIAGWSLGRYQVPSILKTNRVNVILKTVISILVPLILMNLFLFWRSGGSTDWRILLMINSYYSLNNDGGFWFLNVLTQIDLILAGVLLFPQVRKVLRDRGYSMWVLALMAALTFSCVEFFLQNHSPIRTPAQQLWLILLGICIAQSKTVPQKAFLAIIILLVGFDEPGMGIYAWAPVVMCMLVLVVDRIRMPILVSSGVNAIAGASLYIYLTHRLFWELVNLTPLAGRGYVTVFIAGIGGIVVWRLWESLFNPVYAWTIEKWRGRKPSS